MIFSIKKLTHVITTEASYPIFEPCMYAYGVNYKYLYVFFNKKKLTCVIATEVSIAIIMSLNRTCIQALISMLLIFWFFSMKKGPVLSQQKPQT